jgi:hypothetical protein
VRFARGCEHSSIELLEQAGVAYDEPGLAERIKPWRTQLIE